MLQSPARGMRAVIPTYLMRRMLDGVTNRLERSLRYLKKTTENFESTHKQGYFLADVKQQMV